MRSILTKEGREREKDRERERDDIYSLIIPTIPPLTRTVYLQQGESFLGAQWFFKWKAFHYLILIFPSHVKNLSQ